MLGPDSRAAIDTALIGDRRVTQFWDENRVVGRWLADAGVGDVEASGVVWDAYYVFGPEATWNERPGPVTGFGAPVVSERDELERELAPLLG
jgi:hypothetical protein